MLQKLSFLLIAAIILTGCGASAPVEADNGKPEAAIQFSETTATASVSGVSDTSPAEAAPETIEETPEVCAAEYFTFTAESSTITDDGGLTIMLEN